MIIPEDIRKEMSQEIKGKVVESLEWVTISEQVGYWVMTFTDGTGCTLRFMSELVGTLPGLD